MRTSLSSNSYEPNELGWTFAVVDDATLEGLDDTRRVYDTSRSGYSATGHTFADSLLSADRSDLLEYLKTL